MLMAFKTTNQMYGYSASKYEWRLSREQ